MLCHWIILKYEIQIESLHSLRPGNGICERKSGTTWKITTWLTFLDLFITAFRISKDLQRLVNAWPSCRSSSMQRWSKLTQTPRRNPFELQPCGQERSLSCKNTLGKVGRFPCKDLVLHKQFGQIPKAKWHAAFAAAGLPFKSCCLWYDMRLKYSSVILLHFSLFWIAPLKALHPSRSIQRFLEMLQTLSPIQKVCRSIVVSGALFLHISMPCAFAILCQVYHNCRNHQ